MFCSKCGVDMPNEATHCPACGTAKDGLPQQPPIVIKSHLAEAIAATLFCCLPGGIAAIVFACQVNSYLAKGDIPRAQSASKIACFLVWFSAAFGAIAAIFWIAITLLSQAAL